MRRWLIYGFCGLAIAAVAGAGGYKMAEHHDSTSINNLRSQINSLHISSDTSSKPTLKQKTSSLAELMPFKVGFPYNNQPSELGYTVISSYKVGFYSETLSSYAAQLDPKNTCSNEVTPDPLGDLTKTSNLPLTQASADSDGMVAQISGDYYVYTRPKNCSANTRVLNEQKSEVSAVIYDLKQLRNIST